MGQWARSRGCYERALALKRRMGDRPGEARTWFNVGRLWMTVGDGAAARVAYEQALELFTELGLEAQVQRCREAIARL